MPKQTIFKYDPVPALFALNDPALSYFVKRELLGEKVPPVVTLWTLPEPVAILQRQQVDGSWKYSRNKERAGAGTREFFNVVETFRQLSTLTDCYGFDKRHAQVQQAVEFMFSCLRPEGDFRGWLGRQYMPYYTGLFTALIIRAGYADDPRLERIFEWLLTIRQDDGGWAIPFRTRGYQLEVMYQDIPALEPDRSKPSSHLSTEMVLRAFAAHPQYRHSKEAQAAGELLISRLLKRDPYPDRNTTAYWWSSSYPFWFTNIAVALITLKQLGFGMEQAGIREAVAELAKRQDKNGLFKFKVLKNKRRETGGWVTDAFFAITQHEFR